MYGGWLYLMDVIQQHSSDLDYSYHHAKYCLFLAKRSTQVAINNLAGWKYLAKGIHANVAVALSQPTQLTTTFFSLLIQSIKFKQPKKFHDIETPSYKHKPTQSSRT